MTEPSSYARGVREGEVSQELANHAEHLEKINGSVAEAATQLGLVSKQLTDIGLAIARIDQAMTADKETVIKTAAALKDASDVASLQNEARWTPLTRVFAGVAAAGGVVGAIYGVVTLVHG